MQLDQYARGLARRWYVLILMLAVGIFSSYAYFQFFGKQKALATVAASEPALTKAADGLQAQVTFASVIESQTLAQRVIDRLGLQGVSAYALSQDISARLAPSQVPNLLTPLYKVEVSYRDSATALRIADTAVEEARTMFFELNRLDLEKLQASYQAQLDQRQKAVNQSRAALDQFRRTNSIYNPAEQLARQADLVASLLSEQRLRASEIELSEAYAQANTANIDDINRLRGQVEGDLRELGTRMADYNQLQLELSLAEQALSQVRTITTQVTVAKAVDANNPSPTVLSSTIDSAAQRVLNARKTLTSYSQANNITALQGKIDAQVSSLTALEQAQYQALTSGDLSAATTRAERTNLAQLAQALRDSRVELERLIDLTPTFEQLQSDLQLQQGMLAALQTSVEQKVLEQTTLDDVQVKLLDRATIQSQFMLTIAIYVIGGLLGLVVGFAAVYVLAYFDRTVYNVADVEQLMDSIVLATITRG